MRIHYLQHAHFEGINCLKPWIERNGHSLTGTHLYKDDPLPDIDSFDWLIIMGGPMGIYDEEQHPWLTREKPFIKQAIEQSKIILGICLGGQLLADALGAEVRRNTYKEIGWFPVFTSENIQQTVLKDTIPENVVTFHWHGDTFDIPEGAVSFLHSEGCANQGFILGNRTIGLQCHFETDRTFVEHLIKNCAEEIDGSKYVQSESELFADDTIFNTSYEVMESILDYLAKQ